MPRIRPDALWVVLITIVTAVPYVGKLGFYSDDWYVLWRFHSEALRHSFKFHAIFSEFADRPVQGLYLALLYRLFGLQPLGYHLVNTAVIAAAMALFYSLLVRLKVDRASSFAAAVVLIILPQLSTVRVWYVTFQIPLSMVAALISLHCQVSFVRSGKAGWAVMAAVTATISIAAYEIFAPLLAVFPIALLIKQWGEPLRHPLFRRRAAALLGLVAVVALLALAKYAVSARPQPPDLHRYVKGVIQLVRPDYDWRTDYALNVFAAASVHLWWPVLGWWRGAEALARVELGWLDAAAAMAVAALAFWRIRWAGEENERTWSNARILMLGLAAFVLGHAVFVIVPAMSFSPTGMANRALVAAAVGVALIFVASVRLLAGLAGTKQRPLIFSSAFAIIVFAGTLRLLQIEKYWTEAPAIQAKVLAAARADLKSVPAGSFVMLDNVCPYHGPAIIFEAPWDVSGALSLATGTTIRGDAVSPRMSLRREGLASSIYGEPAFYPFGRDLYVYDPGRNVLVQLTDFDVARRYFREHATTRCPRGYVGQGVLI